MGRSRGRLLRTYTQGMLGGLCQLLFGAVSAGCRFSPDEIQVRQGRGWVVIPRAQVHAVKFRNVSCLIVRGFDGRRVVLNLFRFPSQDMQRIADALRSAQAENARRRAAAKETG